MPGGKHLPSDGSVAVSVAVSTTHSTSSFASKAPARVNANSNMSRIMTETIGKEERCRNEFAVNGSTLRKPRNPCSGEETAREDAPFLIPLQKVMKDNIEAEKYLQMERTRAEFKDTADRQSFQISLPVKSRDIAKLTRVHNLRSEVDREIETLKRVAEYKRELLQLRAAPKFGEEI